MTRHELQLAVHSGQRVYGTLIAFPSPRWPQATAPLGLDCVFIDTEHIPLVHSTVAWMWQTYRAMGLPLLVRVVEPVPHLAYPPY